MNLIQEILVNISYQHYNVVVLRTIALLCCNNLYMLIDLKKINDLMTLSGTVASSHPVVALSLIDQALSIAERIRDNRNQVLQDVTMIWYQDWFPRVPEANGRKYVDEVDDAKDYQPVRTVDMSYLIYREPKLPLGQWANGALDARNQFAVNNHLPAVSKTFNWENFQHWMRQKKSKGFECRYFSFIYI